MAIPLRKMSSHRPSLDSEASAILPYALNTPTNESMDEESRPSLALSVDEDEAFIKQNDPLSIEYDRPRSKIVLMVMVYLTLEIQEVATLCFWTSRCLSSYLDYRINDLCFKGLL